MDKEMYTDMSILQPYTPVVDRGIQLHKMMRLITMGLGGEAYLTFMGNEFGHPEWIDFPREGNGWRYGAWTWIEANVHYSFHHCCRRWYLARDNLLRYKHLLAFEKAMLHLEIEHPFLNWKDVYVGIKHEDDKVISFEKANMVWIFNFHTHKSFEGYRIPVGVPGKYELLLDSDREEFGGHKRCDPNATFFTEPFEYYNRPYSMQVYIPCRCALVLKKVD